MSPSDRSADEALINEFINDYYAECDEHLTGVRLNLLALEPFVGRAGQTPAAPPRGAARSLQTILDALLRAFHSIKGLSGMVGVSAAEQLAHDMESVLRTLRTAGTPEQVLTPQVYSALNAGTTFMERIIAARRTGQPMPDITPVTAELAALSPQPDRPAPPPAGAQAATAPGAPDTAAPMASGAGMPLPELNPEELGRLAAARQRGLQAWYFTFTPAPQLAERGVNVSSIRARLEQAGEVIRVTPQVATAGRVTFEFIVTATADAARLAGDELPGVPWAGVSVPEPADPAAAGSPAATPGATSQETPAGPPQAELQAPVAPATMVRVDLARLDELMQHVSELVITRARLAAQIKGLEGRLPSGEWRALDDTAHLVERQLRDLRAAAMRVRLVPIGEIFSRMQFVVHDLARASHKQIRLELSGQETEIDKLVVERTLDPLLHLVRNAVSHGLEEPAERVARGKPAQGRIALRAATAGDLITVQVADDGRGVDVAAVLGQARRLGLLKPGAEEAFNQRGDALTEAGELTEPGAERLLDLLCRPSFSTRQEADLASGRGMGMAVVRDAVADLGGTLALATAPGQGTTFTIQLPLTLAIVDALIVTAGGQRFAVPQLALGEIVEVPPAGLRPLGARRASDNGAGGDDRAGSYVMPYRGGALPVWSLAQVYGLAKPDRQCRFVLVVGTGSQAAGIGVEALQGLREIVVRTLSDPLVQVQGIMGATELGDGRAILILDPAALIRGRR